MVRPVASWSQADLDKLKAAVASGVLSVTYAGPPSRSVTYQSLDAMRSLLSEMERAVAGPTHFRRAVVFKGFRRGGGHCFRRRCCDD